EHMYSGNSHVREPGLSGLLEKHLNKRLFAGSAESFNGTAVEAVIISVDSNYEKPALTPDLRSLEGAARFVGSILKPDQLVIVRTTVPIGTTRKMVAPILEESGFKVKRDFGLAYCPERLVEGAAIKELGRIPQVIGAVD